MNSQHRAIRALLRSISPRRAEAYIRAFHLPETEERLLIALDVRGMTYAQLAEDGFTPEVIKSARRRAYSKIADDMNNAENRRG